MEDNNIFGYFFLFPVMFGMIHLFVYYMVEPLYMYVFKRPLYVHIYLFPRRITTQQLKILQTEVDFYKRLSPRRQRWFEHRVSRFLARYAFVTADGLLLTDQMRVLIAATYVKVTFGFRLYLFPVFEKVVLFPGVYHSRPGDAVHKGEFNPRQKAVVFSWEDFLSGYLHKDDNINLGIHEFTHVMHYWLIKREDNGAALFLHLHKKLMREVLHSPNAKYLRESGYFRDYAFENEYEFLAVMIEHFFETPESLRAKFPELYDRVKQLLNAA